MKEGEWRSASHRRQVRKLKRWADRQIGYHLCMCDDCKSARAMLGSIARAEEERREYERRQQLRP